MSVRVEPGDMLQVIPRLVAEGIVCDAMVTDPPYNLEAMAKRFGPGQKVATSPAHQRFAKGFMGMTWDSDVAFHSETWATVATILRPGAFLIAFGGTRTYHRLVTAMEDAGFVIQDQVAWLFGSGWPKRRDMLKPAFEPIVLAYKPGGKRTMQIDECRIGTDSTTTIRSGNSGAQGIYGRDDRVFERENPPGRWPANVCHDGSEEVTEAFAAFGESKSPSHPVRQGGTRGFDVGSGGAAREGFGIGYADTGSAARFFYCAKADKQDRWGSRHPTVKPAELIKWLIPLVTPAGGLVLDPFAGSGTTGVAALATGRDCILIEREEQYIADIRERLAFYDGGGTHSVQAKARNRKQEDGPLFAATYDPVADGIGSHDSAISEIARRVRSGEEKVPDSGYFGRTTPAPEAAE